MDEALATLGELSPLAAVVVLGGVLATVLTQVAKQAKWSKSVTERVAVGIAVVIGVLAYIVSGVVGVFPAGFVEVVSTGVVIVAGVAVMSRAAYSMIGHAIPDGTTPEPAADAAAPALAPQVNVRNAELQELLETIDRQLDDSRRVDGIDEGP